MGFGKILNWSCIWKISHARKINLNLTPNLAKPQKVVEHLKKKNYMKKLILIIFLSSFSISQATPKNSSDQKKIELQQSTNKKQEHIETVKSEEDSNVKYHGFLIGLGGIVFASFISYRIGIKQSKTTMKTKKKDILENKRKKISEVKSEIIGRKIDLPANQILTDEQVGSASIDKTVYNIMSIMSINEYFEDDFIKNISDFNQSIQSEMQLAKMGKDINQENANHILSNLHIIDQLIIQNINSKLRLIESEINNLL